MSSEVSEAEWAVAMAETESILAADPARIHDRRLPMLVLYAVEQLSTLQEAFASGDDGALLAAVNLCAIHGLPMPTWLASSFERAYNRVVTYEVGSWEEAFGRPIPKGKHRDALKKKRAFSLAVWIEVQHDRSEGTAVSDELFEAVAERMSLRLGPEWAMKKTKVSEYYYFEEKRRRALLKLLEERRIRGCQSSN